MNKITKIIFSCVLCIVLMFSMFLHIQHKSAVAYAADYLMIISPLGGSMYSNTTVTLSAEIPDNADNVEFYIDGAPIEIEVKNADVFSSDLSCDELNLGDHIFEVKVESAGISQTAVSHFKTASVISQINDKLPTKDSNYWDPTVIASCEGIDGEADSGFKMTAFPSSNNAYFYHNPSPLPKYITVVLEADIKRDAGQNIWVEADGYQEAKGGSIYGALAFDKGFVSATGDLLDTGIIVPENEWHNYRIITNLSTRYCEVYYDGSLVKSGTDNDVGNTGIPQEVTNIRFQSWCANSESGLYFDNVKVYEYKLNPQVQEIWYSASDDGDDFVQAQAGIVSALSKRVKLVFDTPFDTITTDDITLNGKKINNAIFDDTELTIYEDEGFEPNSLYTFKFDSALGVGGIQIGKPLCININSGSEVRGIADVEFYADGIECSDSSGLIGASEMKVNFVCKNDSDSPIDGVLIVALYDGTRFAGLKAAEAHLDAASGEVPYPVVLTLPSQSSDLKVECMFLNGFKNPLSLSKVWELK